MLFGIIFGAANTYLGLRAGLTISTSIPVAVMTVAAFRAAGLRIGLLEANMSQTVGSASSSVASGVLFTIPALFLWGLDPAALELTLLAICGGLLGVLFMIPLRGYLIAQQHGKLPYPEGTACAEVLRATEGSGRGAGHVFWGLGVGAGLRLLEKGALGLWTSKLSFAVPLLPRAELAVKTSPALFGVGWILGLRTATIMVSGALLASLVIIPGIYLWGEGLSEPFYPETESLIRDMSVHDLWNRYVRYIGAGAVATAGILTLIKTLPSMVESFRSSMAQMRANRGDSARAADTPRTERDLPLKVVGLGALAIVLVAALVPGVFQGMDGWFERLIAALLAAVFAFFFVTVSSRIVGMVGVSSNPTSAMTITALLGTSAVFLALGWTDLPAKAAALTVGTLVCIAASIAGDCSQDLKTGFLLGSTPRRQQAGELLGVLTCAFFVVATLRLLHEAPGIGPIGGAELPAPQAMLMNLVISGVLDQDLPWMLIAIGAAIGLAVELGGLPSLAFAVGVYLPVSTLTPIFLGALARHFLTRRSANPDSSRQAGVLFGSGLVGGEGLIGVAIAGFALATGSAPGGVLDLWGFLEPAAPLIPIAALFLLFRWRTLTRQPTDS